jgi:non-specific serine/threonine protein kinase
MSTSINAEDHSVYRYRFGSAEFDEARFELQVAGITVEVQPKPLAIASGR